MPMFKHPPTIQPVNFCIVENISILRFYRTKKIFQLRMIHSFSANVVNKFHTVTTLVILLISHTNFLDVSNSATQSVVHCLLHIFGDKCEHATVPSNHRSHPIYHHSNVSVSKYLTVIMLCWFLRGNLHLYWYFLGS